MNRYSNSYFVYCYATMMIVQKDQPMCFKSNMNDLWPRSVSVGKYLSMRSMIHNLLFDSSDQSFRQTCGIQGSRKITSSK